MFKSLKSRLKSTQKKRKSTSLSPRTKSNRTKAATKLQTTFRNKEDCGICLSKMLNIKTQVRLAHCGHTFHRDCINMFVTKGGTTCPNCRTPFITTDIVTPNQYKILVARKTQNQPHTLKKTLRLFDDAITDCKEAYEKYQATIQPRHFAYWNYNDYVSANYPPPRSINPARYFYNKKEARLKKIYLDAAAIHNAARNNYMIKCKAAAPFTGKSRKNFNRDGYREFNEYIQSIYESQNPNTLKKLTTYEITGNPITFD